MTLIKEAKVPVAPPSANFFGKPSSTSVEHVIRDLYRKIDAIIDGGKTEIGIESTVVDLTTRPGGVTLEKFKKFLNEIKIHPDKCNCN